MGVRAEAARALGLIGRAGAGAHASKVVSNAVLNWVRAQEAWLEATLRVNKEGYDTEQISEALEETLKDDPVGTSRFMEDIHRAPQAMMVISMEDDVEDWEMQCHYPQITFQKSMEAVWKVYPRIPHEDPWADNV